MVWIMVWGYKLLSEYTRTVLLWVWILSRREFSISQIVDELYEIGCGVFLMS